MRPTLFRRVRRTAKPSRADGTFFKKETRQENFFGEASHDPFFQMGNSVDSSSPAIQRKCGKCEEDEKKTQRKEDKMEEEKKVMRAEEKKEEEKKIQRQPEKKEEEKVQRAEEKKEEEKDKTVQKKENSADLSVGPGASRYISSLSGKGRPLPADANYFYSLRMGYDFSDVKVHADKEAAESSKELNAKAYTVEN